MSAANHPVSVPIAGRTSPANLTLPAPVRVVAGCITISGSGGTANATLAGLTDVHFAIPPTSGQALVYDEINHRWISGRPAWTLPDWASTHIYEHSDTVYHQGQFWRNILTAGTNTGHEPKLLKAEAIGWFRRGGHNIGPLYPEFVEIGDTSVAPVGVIATHFGAHYAVKYHSDTDWTVWEWKVVSHGPPITFGWHKIDIAHKVTHRHYAEPSPVTADETGLLWIYDEPGTTSAPVVPQRYWEPVVLGDYLVSLADVDAATAVAGDTLVLDANGRWVATPLGTTPGGGGGTVDLSGYIPRSNVTSAFYGAPAVAMSNGTTVVGVYSDGTAGVFNGLNEIALTPTGHSHMIAESVDHVMKSEITVTTAAITLETKDSTKAGAIGVNAQGVTAHQPSGIVVAGDTVITGGLGDARYIQKPANATANQVLTYNGTGWLAANRTSSIATTNGNITFTVATDGWGVSKTMANASEYVFPWLKLNDNLYRTDGRRNMELTWKHGPTPNGWAATRLTMGDTFARISAVTGAMVGPDPDDVGYYPNGFGMNVHDYTHPYDITTKYWADLKYLAKPANATANQVLTYNGTAWGAANASSGGLTQATANLLYQPILSNVTHHENLTIPAVVSSVNTYKGEALRNVTGVPGSQGNVTFLNGLIRDSTFSSNAPCGTFSGMYTTDPATGNMTASGGVNVVPDSVRLNIFSHEGSAMVRVRRNGQIYISGSQTENSKTSSLELIPDSGFIYTPPTGVSVHEGSLLNKGQMDAIYLTKPATATANQVLTYDGTAWGAANASGGSSLPAGASEGQIMQFNGFDWVALDASTFHVKRDKLEYVNGLGVGFKTGDNGLWATGIQYDNNPYDLQQYLTKQMCDREYFAIDGSASGKFVAYTDNAPGYSGQYTLPDGKVMTIQNGVIVSIA